MTSASLNKYIILFELDRDFTLQELKESYKVLLQVWHPDKYTHNEKLKSKAEEKVKDINNGYHILKELINKTRSGYKTKTHKETRFENQSRNNVYIPSIRIKRVFHPTDLSKASNLAFSHAIKISILTKAKLTILHVTSKEKEVQFPRVKKTLIKWGIISEQNSKSDIDKMGFEYDKIVGVHKNPIGSIVNYLKINPTDLIVLSTQQRKGFEKLKQKSVSEPVSRQSRALTLFMPRGNKIGFINSLSGDIKLKRILIPIDNKPNPQISINAATAFVHNLGLKDCMFTMLHVGDKFSIPKLKYPKFNKFKYDKLVLYGNVIDMIQKAAIDNSADLIVMATQGHDSLLDTIRGSTTERFLRESSYPVLAVST